MIINLNATLLVQAFNFGIAYLLIRTLLLKPALAARNQEQAKNDSAVELIARRNQQIEQILYKQHQLWRSCSTYYAMQRPTIIEHGIFRDLEGKPPLIEVSSQEKEKTTAQVIALIEKTIRERL